MPLITPVAPLIVIAVVTTPALLITKLILPLLSVFDKLTVVPETPIAKSPLVPTVKPVLLITCNVPVVDVLAFVRINEFAVTPFKLVALVAVPWNNGV